MPSNVHLLKQSIPESKPKTVRRHGACDPCKKSKTKCDGAEPCSACRSEKRKSRTCVYSDKAQRLAAARQQIEAERMAGQSGPIVDIHNSSHLAGLSTIGIPLPSTDDIYHDPITVGSDLGQAGFERYLMLRPISLCDVVDEFIQLKPPKGQAAQAIHKYIGSKIDDDQSTEPSTMSLFQSPEVRQDCTLGVKPHEPNHDEEDEDEKTDLTAHSATIRRKLNVLKKAAGDRHVTDAWMELGSLIREVEATWSAWSRAGRSFSADDKSWRQLLLDVLELDCLLSFNLGYKSSLPLWQKSQLLSTILRPRPIDDPSYSTRLDILQTMYAVLDADMSHQEGIVEFLQLARLFMKIENSDKPTPVEKVATCTNEKQPLVAQDLKIQANLLLIVIFCRMASVCDFYTQEVKPEVGSNEALSHLLETMDLRSTRQKSTLCRMVIKYANFLLEAFAVLCKEDADNTAQDWTRCHGALIAATLVGVARLREKNSDSENVTKHLIDIEGLFRDLSDRNSKSAFLRKAVECIHGLKSVKAPAHGSTVANHVNSKSHGKSVSGSTESSPTGKRQSLRTGEENRNITRSRKRTIDDVEDESESISQNEKRLRSTLPATTVFQLPMALSEQSSASYMGIQPIDHPSFFEDNSASYHQSVDYGQATSLTSSTNASFAETDPGIRAMAELPLAHPGPPYVFPWDYTTLHPPMVWNTGFIQESYNPEMQHTSNDFPYDSSPVTTDQQLKTGILDESNAHLDASPTFVKPTSPRAAVKSSSNSSTYADATGNINAMSLSEGDKFFNMTAKSFEENQATPSSRRTNKRGADDTPPTTHVLRRQSTNDLTNSTTQWVDTQRRCSVDLLHQQHSGDHSFENFPYGQSSNIQTGHSFSSNPPGSDLPEHSDFHTIRHQHQWRPVTIDTGTHYM